MSWCDERTLTCDWISGERSDVRASEVADRRGGGGDGGGRHHSSPAGITQALAQVAATRGEADAVRTTGGDPVHCTNVNE
jgi:hypothetical protein